MRNNLNSIVKKTATQWKVRAKQDRGNRMKIVLAQEFALELYHFMETHNITKDELAEKLNLSLQQVNKILSAKADLTFETQDKIAIALGVTIPSKKSK